MKHLTGEELKILNACIDYLPYNRSFLIGETHETFVLNQEFGRKIDTRNNVEQLKYIVENNTEMNYYENISYFLVQEGYAYFISKEAGTLDLKLSVLGQWLKVYNSIEEFESIYASVTFDEIFSNMNDTIKRIPLYGEYFGDMHIPEIKRRLIPCILFPNDYSEAELNSRNEFMMLEKERIAAQKESAKSYHKQFAIFQCTLKYLVEHGFAMSRYDERSYNPYIMQLTDKGRELKALGSIQEFDRVQEINRQESIADAVRQAMVAQRNNNDYRRNIYQFWITVSIGIGTVLAALYYLLEILRIHYGLGLPNHVDFH